MAINPLFDELHHAGQQKIINDLVMESIKIHGIDVYYLPRDRNDANGDFIGDDLYLENSAAEYNSNHQIETYIITPEGFAGEGDLLSKFGIEIRDSMTLAVSRDRFEEEITTSNPETIRPVAGDLIYFPLNDKLFEVKFIEHEPVFYQMGSLQFYNLSTELMEYSQQKFNTGLANVDAIQQDFSMEIQGDDSILTTSNGQILYTSTGERLLLFKDEPEEDIFDLETEEDDIVNFDADNPFGDQRW